MKGRLCLSEYITSIGILFIQGSVLDFVFPLSRREEEGYRTGNDEGKVVEMAEGRMKYTTLTIVLVWPSCLRLQDTRVRAERNVLGNVYLISLTKNLWYKEREQLDSGGGGVLSLGAGHDGSFFNPWQIYLLSCLRKVVNTAFL